MLRCRLRWILLAVVILVVSAPPINAQLPFFTDDADTTGKGKFHIEFSNEHDWLQRSSFPGLRQNTSVFTLNYGLTDRFELGVNAPLIKILNDRPSRLGNPSGIGDIQFGVKIRLVDERDGLRRPAASVVFYLEAPTGSIRKQTGSGSVNYSLYGVAQKSLTKRTTGRVNGGILFAGNTSTGLIGIRTDRGQVYTANGSIVRQFSPPLRLGAELFGAVTSNINLSRRQLIAQIGGGYALAENLELTFGVLAGRFAASPRFGFQVGFAYDFK